MYPVTPNFNLPKGYSLKEDRDFLYVFQDKKLIATFSVYVPVEIIQNTINQLEKIL